MASAGRLPNSALAIGLLAIVGLFSFHGFIVYVNIQLLLLLLLLGRNDAEEDFLPSSLLDEEAEVLLAAN